MDGFQARGRILVRYPWLTIVGVIGMAVGITISAGSFAVLYTMLDPALPLDEGDRITPRRRRGSMAPASPSD